MQLAQSSEPEQDQPIPNGAYYVPDRDGTIMEYLRNFELDQTPRAFKTFEHFQILIDNGVITKDLSTLCIIRIYHGNRGDEFYTLNDLEYCEGATVKVHAGKIGKHKIKDILDERDFRHWEISGIDPKFLRK